MKTADEIKEATLQNMESLLFILLLEIEAAIVDASKTGRFDLFYNNELITKSEPLCQKLINALRDHGYRVDPKYAGMAICPDRLLVGIVVSWN